MRLWSKMLYFSRMSFFLFFISLSSSLYAQAKVKLTDLAGVTVISRGDVNAVFNKKSRRLVRRDGFFQGDKLVTGKNSSAIFKFKDKTLLKLRANSRMVVSSYQYSPRTKRGVLHLALAGRKGQFLFVSGEIAKKDIEIKTHIGVLGVRGTAFYFRYNTNTGDGILQVVEGSVVVNGIEVSAGQQIIVRDGKLLSVSPVGRDRFDELIDEVGAMRSSADKASTYVPADSFISSYEQSGTSDSVAADNVSSTHIEGGVDTGVTYSSKGATDASGTGQLEFEDVVDLIRFVNSGASSESIDSTT